MLYKLKGFMPISYIMCTINTEQVSSLARSSNALCNSSGR